jgi:hypothetical protein
MRLDRALWRDYKRHRKWWLRRKLAGGNKFVVYIFVSWILVQAALHGRGAHAVLVGIALYALATALFRGLNFRLNVLQGYDRALFLHFPVSDAEFLKYEWRKFGWSWFGAFCLFFLAYATTALSTGSVERYIGKAAFAALLQSICGMAFAIWVMVLVPKLKIVSSALPIYALTLACLWLPASALDFLWSAVLLVPGGWVSHSFAALVGVSSKAEVGLLLPALTLGLSLPLASRFAHGRLLSALESQTTDKSSELDQIFGPSEEQAETDSMAPAVQPFASAVSHVDVEQRPNWRRSGWIEKIVGLWLNDEEKLVAEFMLAQHLGEWSRRWRTAAMLTAIGTIITSLVAQLPPWLSFLPIVAAGLWGAPLFGGIWLGFRGTRTFGGVIPAYAAFPIAYGEISRVMFKANTIRIFAWVPIFLLYAIVLATRLGNGPQYGAEIGIEVVVLALLVQPVMITAHFSSGSNDTRQLNRYTVAFFGMALILLIPLIAAIVAFLVSESILLKCFAAIGVLACTTLASAGYMRLFNRGRIDLLSRPR